MQTNNAKHSAKLFTDLSSHSRNTHGPDDGDSLSTAATTQTATTTTSASTPFPADGTARIDLRATHTHANGTDHPEDRQAYRRDAPAPEPDLEASRSPYRSYDGTHYIDLGIERQRRELTRIGRQITKRIDKKRNEQVRHAGGNTSSGNASQASSRPRTPSRSEESGQTAPTRSLRQIGQGSPELLTSLEDFSAKHSTLLVDIVERVNSKQNLRNWNRDEIKELNALIKERQQIGRKIAALELVLRKEQHGTALERFKSPATKALEQAWKDAEREDADRLLRSHSKHFMNLVAGAWTNGVSFGIGNLIAASTGRPWLSVLNAAFWTFFEPSSAMWRHTTVTSPATETYLFQQRVIAHGLRDLIRERLGNIPPEEKFPVTDPQTGTSYYVNAAKVLDSKAFLKTFAIKSFTEDLPYLIWYSGILTLLLFAGYRDHKWIRFFGGLASGAGTMVTSQQFRRLFSDREIATKDYGIWAMEAQYRHSFLEDLDACLEERTYERGERFLVRKAREVEAANLAKAIEKSCFLSSFVFELRAVFRKNVAATQTDPETPGRRLEFFSNSIGRPALLAATVAFALHVARPLQEREDDPDANLLGTLVQGATLIIFTFGHRMEYSFLARLGLSALKGVIDVIGSHLGLGEGRDDQDDDSDSASSHGTSSGPDGRSASTERDDSEDSDSEDG